MKKRCILGFIFVSVLGVLFHFLYEYIPLFIFPSSESIFEHTKLIIVPMSIYLFILMCIKFDKKLFSSIVSSIVIGVSIVVSGYYTYNGMFGVNLDWLNILIYFIAVMVMFFRLYKNKTLFSFPNSVIVLIIIYLLLIVFSFYPIDIPFFS